MDVSGEPGRYVDDPAPDWWPDDDEARTPAEDLMTVGLQVRESLGMSLAEFGEARLAGALDRSDVGVVAMSDMADLLIDQRLAPRGHRFGEEEAGMLAAALGEPRLAALFRSYRPA